MIKTNTISQNYGYGINSIGNSNNFSGNIVINNANFGIYLQGEPVDPIWWIRFTKQIEERNQAVLTLHKRKLSIKY